MTEENKKENIKIELAKASEMLSEAELLYNNNFIAGVYRGFYYSLLHTIRALLLTKGLEPKSHEGTLRLFVFHFVKEDIFQTRASHIFSKLMKYREEADYNPIYKFTKEDFVEFKEDVEELSDKIRAYLAEKGYYEAYY